MEITTEQCMEARLLLRGYLGQDVEISSLFIKLLASKLQLIEGAEEKINKSKPEIPQIRPLIAEITNKIRGAAFTQEEADEIFEQLKLSTRSFYISVGTNGGLTK